VEDRVTPFLLPNPEKMLASPLLRMEEAEAGYAPGAPVLTNLNLRIDQDDRIALLGQNGNGKSTFAKLIAGRLQPLSGQVFGANRVTVGYFAQHQLDDLNPLATPYDYIVKLMPEATEAQKRTKLGTFGFGADKADTKCANLSGGEKARLLLALTAFHAPHILILDEPTNHLDIDSREALIHALAEYEGAVILISHDRHLVEATADRLWIVRDGSVSAYDGDMDSYRAELLAERGATMRRRATDGLDGGEGRTDRAAQRRVAAQRRQQLAPLKKVMQDAENRVEKLTAELARLDAALADPALYADPPRAQKATLERRQAAKKLAEAEEAWLSATAAFEEAEQAAQDAPA
jgi:ATP-binding cassette subfamily F protein 3